MNAKLFAIFCAGLMLIGGSLAILGTEETDAANPGSSSDRQTIIYTTIDDFVTADTYYLYVGAYLNITVGDSDLYFSSVPSSISRDIVINQSTGDLSGYMPASGTFRITVNSTASGEQVASISLNTAYQDGISLSINKGVYWSYFPTTSMDSNDIVDTHLNSNVEGPRLEAEDESEFISWLPGSTGNAKLVISVRSSNPAQCAVQTINITVVETIEPVASLSSNYLYIVAGGHIPNSVREAVYTSTNIDGATWSVEGVNNTGLTITSAGVIGGTAASSAGTHTITLKATNGEDTARCTLTVYIVAKLVITSTPTGNA